MIIVGAGGFAKELLSCLKDNGPKEVAFFDDFNTNITELYGLYDVLKNEAQVNLFFTKKSREFTIGIGNPILRKKMYEKFIGLGGIFISVISNKAHIGQFDVHIGEGVNILAGVNISNSVQIGMGTMIYYNSNITHDCEIGDFVEISPSVNILGRSTIGNYSTIGTGAIILPDIKIGSSVTVAAGAVVTKNIKDGIKVKGVPAKPF